MASSLALVFFFKKTFFKISFPLVLWEFCVKYFDHIRPSSNFCQTFSLFLPLLPNFVDLTGPHHKKKKQLSPFLSNHVPIAPELRLRLLVNLPFLCCDFVWLEIVLLLLFWGHMHSHIAVSGEHNHPLSSALAILPLLLQWFQSLGRRRKGLIQMPHLGLRVPVSYSLYLDQLGVSVNHHLLKTETSLMRVLRCHHCGYNNDKSLGDGLLLCPFTWIVVGSPPEPMICWHSFANTSRCLPSRWLQTNQPDNDDQPSSWPHDPRYKFMKSQ